MTSSPQDYIQFQPGDVLGVYVEEALGDNDGVVAIVALLVSPVRWCGMPALIQTWPPLRMETVPIQLGAVVS